MRRGSVHTRKLSAAAYMVTLGSATLIQAEVGGLIQVDWSGGVGNFGSAAMWSVTWGLTVDGIVISQGQTQGNAPSFVQVGGLSGSIFLPRGWHTFSIQGIAGSDATWGWLASSVLSVKEI
jgi:hypothetical protein